MKKSKLIIIIIAAALVIAGTIILVLNLKKKEETFKEASTEVKDKAAKRLDYFMNLTKYYTTKYNGADILFSKDKTEFDDISEANLIRIATEYISNELDSSIQNATINRMVAAEGINKDNYTFYSGEKVKKAIKDLFGVDFKNKSIIGEKGFKYNYEYYEDYDIYLASINKEYSLMDSNYQLDYKIIKTEEGSNGNVKVTFAIAYVYADRTNSIARYAKEPNDENYVYNVAFSELGIKEEDKFNQYILTLEKQDNNYIFKSIEKK